MGEPEEAAQLAKLIWWRYPQTHANVHTSLTAPGTTLGSHPADFDHRVPKSRILGAVSSGQCRTRQKLAIQSPPLSAGNTFQDPQWMLETVDSMESYAFNVFSYTDIRFNLKEALHVFSGISECPHHCSFTLGSY